MKVKAFVVAILASLLAACASPVNGKVISKNEVPSSTSVVVSCNAKGICQPITVYNPGSYTFVVEECLDGCKRRDVSVNSSEYKKYSVGDNYVRE